MRAPPRLRLVLGVSLALAGMVVCGSGAWALLPYDVTDLGTLGGDWSQAYGLNDSAQVAGKSANSVGERAFVWDLTMQSLGTFEGGGASWGRDINNDGDVVGHAAAATGVDHAFLYTNGEMQDLGTLDGNQSRAYAINDSGQIAGYSTTSGGPVHAAVYESGNWTDLGTLGGNESAAYAINDSGDVAGYSAMSGGDHAAVYESGNWTDLGSLLDGYANYAWDINNIGQVVGEDYLPSLEVHAFVYGDDDGDGDREMSRLDTLGGYETRAYAISDSGQIVGHSYTKNDQQHAVIWDDRTIEDLNDWLMPSSSEWTLHRAYDINDSGQIVGYGTNGDGNLHAFLATPTPELPSCALLALTAGMFGLVWWRKRSATDAA